MIGWLRSSIFRRTVIAILAVALLPLLILGGLALRSGDEAGDEASQLCRTSLDTKAAESLEIRAQETAHAIALFLADRENDLRSLVLLPRDAATYRAFGAAHQATIWHQRDRESVVESIPLYTEIAFIDDTGQEIIKIADGQIAPARDLHNVSDPVQTRYLAEDYFTQARDLAPDEIYVSHVTGFYVDRAAFASGERFSGVLRFAMPVFDTTGDREGVVVLALDQRHLEEFTAHIVPTADRRVIASDAASGNYAYIIDDQSYVIAHPNDFLINGLTPDGTPISYAATPEEIGTHPIRLDQLGFMDEHIAQIPTLTAQGQTGSIQYYWDANDKFVAFAPIPYYGGQYQEPAGFGWVGIGAEVATFHQSATLVDDAITDKVTVLAGVTLLVLTFTGLIVLVVAGLLARQISAPIECITRAAEAVENRNFHPDILTPLLARRGENEITRLARVFNRMAGEVQRRDRYRELLDVVISIGVTLPEEKDFDRLLEKVVVQAQHLSGADAGSLYLRTEDDRLRFVIFRNETLHLTLGGTTGRDIPYPPVSLYDETGAPNHHNVASHTVLTGTTLNIPDVSQFQEFDFSGTQLYDAQTGYRSRSFLCVPLKDSSGKVIGVLQMINARHPQTGAVIPFEEGMNRIIESLSELGTVALQAYQREASLRQKIELLQIEIDQAKRDRQVAEITETDYFRELQRKAALLRQRLHPR